MASKSPGTLRIPTQALVLHRYSWQLFLSHLIAVILTQDGLLWVKQLHQFNCIAHSRTFFHVETRTQPLFKLDAVLRDLGIGEMEEETKVSTHENVPTVYMGRHESLVSTRSVNNPPDLLRCIGQRVCRAGNRSD